MVACAIDPTKVTRSALQHAASIAALMLTTEAMIADKGSGFFSSDGWYLPGTPTTPPVLV